MLDWLIIGGGLQGHHLAARLLGAGKVERARLRILDPHDEPFAVWRRCTRNTGMRFLRSPQVHHIGLAPFALRSFAATPTARGVAAFRSPYSRPGLAFFDLHCDAVRRSLALDEAGLRGTAQAIHAITDGLRVETDHGAIEARNVALALGASDCLEWPDWARALREVGASIHHIFEPGFVRASMRPWGHAVVIGGGITAAQMAMTLGEPAHGLVTMLSPHPIRRHLFDADPGWIGPRHLHAFHAQQDPSARRAMIRDARQRGTMPPEVAKDLRRTLDCGVVALVEDSVAQAHARGPGAVDLVLARSRRRLRADVVLLATGFAPRRPGAFLDQAIDTLGLRCAPCGYPIIDQALRWHPRVRVMGPLAELEVGPIARNLSGARDAAARIVASV